jgi:hypothetical protein
MDSWSPDKGSRRRLTPSRPFGLRSGSLASDRKCAGPNRCLGLKGACRDATERRLVCEVLHIGLKRKAVGRAVGQPDVNLRIGLLDEFGPEGIDTTTNFIEHPRVVAARIERFVSLVGPERVIAGTDCGFSTFAGFGAVDPEIVWAKLEALAEGPAIASEQVTAWA